MSLDPQPAISPIRSRILYFISWIISRIFFRLEWEGVENMPKDGPVLMLAKHQSNQDVPLGYYLVKKHVRKDMWCMIKQSLTSPIFLGIYTNSGGIPVDRADPAKSKPYLIFARKTLHAGGLIVIFPEQSRYMGKMGRGRSPGFRFIMGKPAEPITVTCVGYEYIKQSFGRTKVVIRIGPPRPYAKTDDPEAFLYDRMVEIAELSNLTYKFPKPAGRGKPASGEES